MDFVLLGTGCPNCDPQRLGPSNLVRHGAHTFLVDCGSGVSQRLVQAGTPGKALEAVLLTHLHSDHTVDLLQLIMSSWHQGRDRPQKILGPKGTKRFVDGLLEFWRPEFEQRIAHEKRPSTLALQVEVQEIEDGEIISHADMTVRAVRVEHSPIKNAFGFVFEAAGRKLAFSGDTAFCPALIEASRNADVLVHECFIHREMKIIPGVRTQEGTDAVASYHTLSSEVGKVAAQANVKCLVLNHFVPTQFDRAALLADVRADYDGPIVIGEDLLGIDLSTGALTYQQAMIGLDALA
ncbi:MAG: fold metallo-hydrolase [Alphaproteobacteria bacterium]|nr:fold metallo-hydrolase [Alphaproteobacteria bacterium]